MGWPCGHLGHPFLFSTLQITASLSSKCPNPQACMIFLFYLQCSCIQNLSRSLVVSQIYKHKFPFWLPFSGSPLLSSARREMLLLPHGLLGGRSLPRLWSEVAKTIWKYGSSIMLRAWLLFQSFPSGQASSPSSCLLHYVLNKLPDLAGRSW